MFFKFDYSLFPIVIIEFNSMEITENDFEVFLNFWQNIYNHDKDFMLIFDTTNMSIPSLKYCFKMSVFIKNLRKMEKQYLKKSIMIMKNQTLCNMLDFIFYLQPPVADIHITKETLSDIMEKIKKNNDICDISRIEYINLQDIEIYNTIKPDKPFLPFL
jgi:hypothetical protein